MEWLLQQDEWLFKLINGQWHTPLLDAILPLLREKTFWIPAYILFCAWLVLRYKWQAVWITLALIATVALSDTISHRIIKKQLRRERPCRQLPQDEVRLLVHCGGGYSFTSNHAANHFALAMFILGLWGRRIRFGRWLLPLWAASIAYAQVYVGVHFPLDVIGGALLGSIIGYPAGYLLRKRLWPNETQFA